MAVERRAGGFSVAHPIDGVASVLEGARDGFADHPVILGQQRPHQPRPSPSGLAGHLVHNREQFRQRLFARGRIRLVGAQRRQRLVDGLVNDMPVRRRARLQARFGVVPRTSRDP